MADREPKLMHGDETMSPVDLPGAADEEPHPLRWTGIGIALATVFLLLFNATTLDGWARELPPGPAAARLTALTGAWAETTGRIGLNAPHATMHAWWKQGEAARFPE